MQEDNEGSPFASLDTYADSIFTLYSHLKPKIEVSENFYMPNTKIKQNFTVNLLQCVTNV